MQRASWTDRLTRAGATLLIASIPLHAEPRSVGLADVDQDGIDDTLEDQLMRRFGPELHLYPFETYRPSAVRWLLPGVALAYDQEPCTPDQLLPLGSVFGASLTRQWARERDPSTCAEVLPFISSGLGPVSTEFYLEIDPSRYEGELATAPCYAHVSLSQVPGAMYDVQYWFFYPYNGPLLLGLGYHEGDWEHVTVRILADEQTLHSVHMSQHSEGTDYFPGGGLLQLVDGVRPVVFSARHSHASYATAGVHSRPFPLPADRTRAGGPVMDCSQVSVNVGEKGAPRNGATWLHYSGDWGRPNPFPFSIFAAGGPSGPAYKSSWLPATQE